MAQDAVLEGHRGQSRVPSLGQRSSPGPPWALDLPPFLTLFQEFLEAPKSPKPTASFNQSRNARLPPVCEATKASAKRQRGKARFGGLGCSGPRLSLTSPASMAEFTALTSFTRALNPWLTPLSLAVLAALCLASVPNASGCAQAPWRSSASWAGSPRIDEHRRTHTSIFGIVRKIAPQSSPRLALTAEEAKALSSTRLTGLPVSAWIVEISGFLVLRCAPHLGLRRFFPLCRSGAHLATHSKNLHACQGDKERETERDRERERESESEQGREGGEGGRRAPTHQYP